MQQSACNVQHASCNVQHTACSIQHTACIMQHAACIMQHATCNTSVAGGRRHRDGRPGWRDRHTARVRGAASLKRNSVIRVRHCALHRLNLGGCSGTTSAGALPSRMLWSLGVRVAPLFGAPPLNPQCQTVVPHAVEGRACDQCNRHVYNGTSRPQAELFAALDGIVEANKL